MDSANLDELQWTPVPEFTHNTEAFKVKGESDIVAMRIADLEGNAHYFSSSKGHLLAIAKEIISLYDK